VITLSLIGGIFMPSYVTLELDTTSPTIEIFAPKYTTETITNVITIESNEKLAKYQDIYVIDSKGVRHDYTFEKDSDNTYVGIIRFNNYPIGIATIYARMKDEVDNFSNVATSSIEIKEGLTLLSLEIKDSVRELELKDTVRSVEVDERTMRIEIEDFDNYEDNEVF
jgi:hypothetical protein